MPRILQKAERVASGVEHDIALGTLSEEHVAGELGTRDKNIRSRVTNAK